jgi:predicted O-methyltransferase YrrM
MEKGSFNLSVNHAYYASMLFSIPFIRDAKVIVETGLSEGNSANIFLTALSHLPNPESRELHTYEIEPDKDSCMRAKVNIANMQYPAKWYLHSGDSVKGGTEWTGSQIDFLFLDSDHSVEHVYNELRTWTPHLSSKALISSDDTWLNNEKGNAPDLALHGIRKWLSENNNWHEFTFKEFPGQTLLYR